MKKLLVCLCASALFLGVVTSANATVWTDTYAPDNIPLYMQAGDEETISFDITGDGFDSNFWDDWNRDVAIWYQVEVYATDDLVLGNEGFWGTINDTVDWNSNGEEYFTMSTGWWGGSESSYEAGLGVDVYGDNFWGLVSLNLNGALDLNLQATQGDFLLWGATLTASNTAPVPEPATMLLMGLGLAGLVGYNRKRSSKKA